MYPLFTIATLLIFIYPTTSVVDMLGAMEWPLRLSGLYFSRNLRYSMYRNVLRVLYVWNGLGAASASDVNVPNYGYSGHGGMEPGFSRCLSARWTAYWKPPSVSDLQLIPTAVALVKVWMEAGWVWATTEWWKRPQGDYILRT